MESSRLSSCLELSFQCAKCVRCAAGKRAPGRMDTDSPHNHAPGSLDSSGFFGKSDAAVLVYLRYSPTDEWQLVGQTGAGARKGNLPAVTLGTHPPSHRAPTRSRHGGK